MTTPKLSLPTSSHLSPKVPGIYFLIAGMFVLSLQNIAVRAIDERYAVLEIVVVRSLVAMPCTLLLLRYEGNRGLPRTTKRRLHVMRGLLLFVAYTTYFMGLAAIPLADATEVRFSSVLFLTLFSVLMLGEMVGVRRWLAVTAGFDGVLLIVKPGAITVNIGSLFVLITAITISLSSILTRRLRFTDSSAAMAYYSTLVYLGAALILGPVLSTAGADSNAHPSIAFLLRSWAVPTLADLTIMVALGLFGPQACIVWPRRTV